MTLLRLRGWIAPLLVWAVTIALVVNAGTTRLPLPGLDEPLRLGSLVVSCLPALLSALVVDRLPALSSTWPRERRVVLLSVCLFWALQLAALAVCLLTVDQSSAASIYQATGCLWLCGVALPLARRFGAVGVFGAMGISLAWMYGAYAEPQVLGFPRDLALVRGAAVPWPPVLAGVLAAALGTTMAVLVRPRR